MKTKNRYGSVAGVGMDVHHEFSTVTMRDAKEKVVPGRPFMDILHGIAGEPTRLCRWP